MNVNDVLDKSKYRSSDNAEKFALDIYRNLLLDKYKYFVFRGIPRGN